MGVGSTWRWFTIVSICGHCISNVDVQDPAAKCVLRRAEAVSNPVPVNMALSPSSFG